jgi:hypothetical protein
MKLEKMSTVGIHPVCELLEPDGDAGVGVCPQSSCAGHSVPSAVLLRGGRNIEVISHEAEEGVDIVTVEMAASLACCLLLLFSLLLQMLQHRRLTRCQPLGRQKYR